MHHGPHLRCRPLAEVPRPPREHLQQPPHHRHQRGERRDEHRQEPGGRTHAIGTLLVLSYFFGTFLDIFCL